MQRLWNSRTAVGFRRKAGIFFAVPVLSLSLLSTQICLAAEPAPETAEGTISPSTGTAEEEGTISSSTETAEGEGTISPSSETAEGEGMLSPSSEESKKSVFGGSAAAQAAAGTDEKLETLIAQIQGSLPAGNGSWSVFIGSLANNTEGSINEHRMQAASLIKLYIMGAVYENYDSLIGQYGQDTVDSTLRSMITVSDNDAANTLTGYLGGGDTTVGMSVVNSFCQAHGYTQSSMGRLLLQSTEFGDNYTSVSDCGHFLQEVYKGEKSEFAHADDMLAILSAQERRNKIPAQMPEGVSIANKTGELSDVENDAAVIYNTANDLVIVFMTEGLAEVGAAQSTIASLSRQIYDYYNP